MGVDIPPKILKIRFDKKLILRGENGNLKIFFAKRENFFQKIVLFSDFYLIKIEKAKISHFFRIWRIPPNQIFHAQTKQNLATLAEFRHFWSHWSGQSFELSNHVIDSFILIGFGVPHDELRGSAK